MAIGVSVRAEDESSPLLIVRVIALFPVIASLRITGDRALPTFTTNLAFQNQSSSP